MTVLTTLKTTFDRSHMGATLKAFFDYLDAEPNLLQDVNAGQTSASVTLVLPIDAYQIALTTAAGGAHTDVVAMPDPTANGIIGQRNLVKMAVKTDASDKIHIDTTLLSDGVLTVTQVELANVGDWVLLEHRGIKWEIVAAKSGVVTAS